MHPWNAIWIFFPHPSPGEAVAGRDSARPLLRRLAERAARDPPDAAGARDLYPQPKSCESAVEYVMAERAARE